jgi:hypothetical protein
MVFTSFSPDQDNKEWGAAQFGFWRTRFARDGLAVCLELDLAAS